jgi:hypothetical protein
VSGLANGREEWGKGSNPVEATRLLRLPTCRVPPLLSALIETFREFGSPRSIYVNQILMHLSRLPCPRPASL